MKKAHPTSHKPSRRAMSAAVVPACLKKCKPFVLRAGELEADDQNPDGKIIAYFCCLRAIDEAMSIRKEVSEGEKKEVEGFILNIMKLTEAAKPTLGASSNPEVGRPICESFAYAVFAQADDEDRSGRATKNTAKTFYNARTFFDILDQFGEVDAEIKEKKKYCSYKAVDIVKAINEGRMPAPGLPGEETVGESGGFAEGGDVPQPQAQGEAPAGELRTLNIPEPPPPALTGLRPPNDPNEFIMAPLSPPMVPTPGSYQSVTHYLSTCHSLCIHLPLTMYPSSIG